MGLKSTMSLGEELQYALSESRGVGVGARRGRGGGRGGEKGKEGVEGEGRRGERC